MDELKIVKRKGKFEIVGKILDEDIGPYDNEKEAKEALRGIRQFFKYEIKRKPSNER